MVLVFSVGLGIAIKAGLMGLPLAVLLVPWYFKYVYFLFDSVVRGVDEPPVLDIQMLNPFGERRPLVQLFIVIMVLAIIELTDIYVGRLAADSLRNSGCVGAASIGRGAGS